MERTAPRTQGVAHAASRYARAVHQAAKTGELEHLLASLLVRDEVERNLEDLDHPDTVKQVAETDQLLRSLTRRLAYQKDLAACRRVPRPAEQAWWWFPQRQGGSIVAGLVDPASLVLVPFSLGVAIDFAHKFGGEGGGFQRALPIAATALASVSVPAPLSPGLPDALTTHPAAL